MSVWIAFTLVLLVMCNVLPAALGKPHSMSQIEYQRLKFLNTFEKTCKKYKFYDTYMNNLKHPRSKHVTFVMQEKGFRNGGFGDRLAGLIHAAAVALMMNRTLVIQSDNEFGFHRLFRPYASDINTKYEYSDDSTTSWKKNDTDVPYSLEWGPKQWAWSNFDPNMRDNDNNEYDLYMCINNGGGGTARRCALLDGDVPQPIIKLKTNRAYLCQVDRSESIPLYNLWRNVLGIPKNSNLFEVAGCLLRLVMWPTEELWGYIDEYLDANKRNLIKQGLLPAGSSSNGWQSSVTLHYRCGDVSWGANAATNCVADPAKDYSKIDYMSAATPIEEGGCGAKVIKSLQSDNAKLKEPIKETTATTATSGSTANNGDHKALLAHLTELFRKGSISEQEYKEILDLTSTTTTTTSSSISSSSSSSSEPLTPWEKFVNIYWQKKDAESKAGAPKIRRLENSSLKGLVVHLGELKQKGLISEDEYNEVVDMVKLAKTSDINTITNTVSSNSSSSRSSSATGEWERFLNAYWKKKDEEEKVSGAPKRRRLRIKDQKSSNDKKKRSLGEKSRITQETVASNSNNVFAYITSDSQYSAKQVNDTMNWSNSLMSSSSCHLEWAGNFDCLKMTILDWFIMATSDAIVAQFDQSSDVNRPSTPKSAYSRFAAVYSLQPLALRDAKRCNRDADYKISDMNTLSNTHQGNWWCQS